MAIVYQHIRKDTGEVFYVGIGKNKERAYRKSDRNRYWKNVVKKHDYIVEIIYNDLTWELACQMERYLISSYGRRDQKKGNLVNLTDGGEGVLNISEETRKIKSEKSKGNKSFSGRKHTEEHKKKMSEMFKGREFTDEHKNKISKSKIGKKASESTKIKMSIAQKGKVQSEQCKEKLRNRVFSEETLKKMSKAQKNRVVSDETRAKLSIANTGKVSPTKGIPKSEEHKQKLRKPKSEEQKQKLRGPRENVCCPFCGKIGGISNMKRYHFQNCNNK